VSGNRDPLTSVEHGYIHLAATLHPVNGGDPAIFEHIQAAYDTLHVSKKRAVYDHECEFEYNPHISVRGEEAYWGWYHVVRQQVERFPTAKPARPESLAVKTATPPMSPASSDRLRRDRLRRDRL
jgi:curved DNA-binding protein CbpA